MITIIKAIDWDGKPNPYVTLLSVEHDAAVDPVRAIIQALEEFALDEDTFIGWMAEYNLDFFVWWAYTEDIPKKYLKKYGIKSIDAPNTMEVNDTYGVFNHKKEEEDEL